MSKVFIKTVAVLFSATTLLGQISEPKKITGPTSLKNEIERTEIALTGGFTQAFESKNLLLFPATEENFNKWQQGVAAAQKLVAKSASTLGRFVDPLVDINRILNQTFIKLREYHAKLSGAHYNKANINGMLKPLIEAQASLIKVKNNFTQYQKQKPSRFEKLKSIFKKSDKKGESASSSDTAKESDFYPLVNRIIMTLDILIERMLIKDVKSL